MLAIQPAGALPAVCFMLNSPIRERFNLQIRLDFQNVFHNYAWSNLTTTVDLRNPKTFGKISADQRTSSVGGQPLMNLKIQLSW